MVKGNTFYLLHNSLYLLCSGCQYVTRLICEIQIYSCFQTFSNFKFRFLLRELKIVFQTERLFFPLTVKDFKSSISNSTLQAKTKCSKRLVTFCVCDRHICKCYKKCLSSCNKAFVLQLRMQNTSQLENCH